VVYINYTMASRDLPDIYAHALGPAALELGHLSKSLLAIVRITITYIPIVFLALTKYLLLFLNSITITYIHMKKYID